MKLLKTVFAIILLAPMSAGAVNLSLEQAVGRIVKASEDIKKADANIQKMQAVIKEVNSNRWFNLEGSASYINTINVENPGKTQTLPMFGDFEIPNNYGMLGVSVTQPIYTFGKIGNAVDAAHEALTMSKFEKEIYVREMTYAAIQMYYNAKASDKLVEIAEHSLNNAMESERLLKDSGAQRAFRSNLIKVSADIASRKPVLEEAKLNQEQAYRMLRVFAEIPENESIVLTDDFDEEFKTFDASNLRKALNTNPKLDLLDTQVKYYESSAKSKKAEHNPTIAATAGYNYFAGYTDLDMWHGFKSQGANVGLSLKIPLFDGGSASAKAMQDYAEATKSQEEFNKSKKNLSMDLENAISKYEKLVKIYNSQIEAKELAQKSYELSLDRFKTGQTSAVELNDVEQALTGAEKGILNTLFQMVLTEATIQKLTGDYND